MFKMLVDFTMKNRNLWTHCRKKTHLSKKSFLYHRFVKYNEYRNLLIENLSLDTKDVEKVLFYQQLIFAIPQEHVVKQCQLCQKLQVDPSTLFKNAELLRWPSNILRHRVFLLRDMGILNLHAAMVSSFHGTSKLRLGLFKAFLGIPESVNIADNLLKCLHEPPPSVPPMEVLSESLTVNDYHKRCLRWYIEWRLEVDKEDRETINHLLSSMKLRSFSLMKRLFDTLHSDIGLTIEQIKKHSCLSAGSAEDLSRIIKEIKTFAGEDFKTLIKRHPALHAMEFENVVEVMKLLDAHGFKTKAKRRCPEILIINSSVIASRLKTLESTPELRVLKNNAKILVLIYNFNLTRVRLEYLRYLNIKHVTVRNLTAQHRHFERFIRTGIDRTKGKELRFSLEKSLKLDSEEILRRIKKHPFWRHVDLMAMHETLEFLLRRFAPEDLHDSLQLLLYPREKIEEILESLPELNEESKKTEPLQPKKILAICLYEMEREHHFTGDGVWRYDAPPPRRRDSPTKSLDSELSDFSDSETAESEESEETSKNISNIK